VYALKAAIEAARAGETGNGLQWWQHLNLALDDSGNKLA